MSKNLSKLEAINRYYYVGKLLVEDCRFPYAVIKGEPLSLMAYNQLGKRNSLDIDILLSRKHLSEMERILVNNGFETKQTTREDQILIRTFSHQIVSYKKKTPLFNVVVDLNFDVFWGEYEGTRINIEKFLEDPTMVNIYGYDIKTLSPIKTFVQLVLHHYKELNSIYHLASHNCIRQSMFKDVFFLLQNNSTLLTPNNICKISELYDIKPYVYYILYFTYFVFPHEFLKPYVEMLYDDTGVYLLDFYGLSKDERKRWQINVDTRLRENNLFEYIKNDLNENDYYKLKKNKDIFSL